MSRVAGERGESPPAAEASFEDKECLLGQLVLDNDMILAYKI
jgi:hypothetical protein